MALYSIIQTLYFYRQFLLFMRYICTRAQKFATKLQKLIHIYKFLHEFLLKICINAKKAVILRKLNTLKHLQYYATYLLPHTTFPEY